MPSEPKTLSITHWAEADRPREKLERLGANALSDAELLAILIGSGTPKESAVDLMKRILNDCKNNLNSLGKLSLHDLEQYKGIGPAKAITILAACELGKRRQKATVEEAPILNSADGIYQFMHTTIQDLDIEEAWGFNDETELSTHRSKAHLGGWTYYGSCRHTPDDEGSTIEEHNYFSLLS